MQGGAGEIPLIPLIIQPPGWAAPKGYSNGMAASGQYISVAGQVGWNPVTCEFATDDFAEQTRQSLLNVVAVLKEAGASPSDVVRLTWYIINREEYMEARRAVGDGYREIMGNHYPAMSVVIVAGLLEMRAKVEIEATAVISHAR